MMRISISNIAWDRSEDPAVAELLAQHGVSAVDVAPGKYFSDPESATEADVQTVRTWWNDRGIEITGMQALLFGTQGLNLFGPAEVQKRMLVRLDAVCRIGAVLGATRLVFGSPKNRDCAGLAAAEVNRIALDFFCRLADIAGRHGVLVCLEPNPSRYGANFMCNTEETLAVVRAIGHPSIRMQLDTGAMSINRESPEQLTAEQAQWVGHIHLSEPDLVTLGDSGIDHRPFQRALSHLLPGHVACIEMLASAQEPHLVAVDRAVALATRIYGCASPGAAA